MSSPKMSSAATLSPPLSSLSPPSEPDFDRDRERERLPDLAEPAGEADRLLDPDLARTGDFGEPDRDLGGEDDRDRDRDTDFDLERVGLLDTDLDTDRLLLLDTDLEGLLDTERLLDGERDPADLGDPEATELLDTAGEAPLSEPESHNFSVLTMGSMFQ